MPPISESIYVIHFPHILFFMSAPGSHKTQKYALYSIAPYISIIQSVSLKFKWHSCGKIQKNAAIRGSTTAFFYILINSLGVLKDIEGIFAASCSIFICNGPSLVEVQRDGTKPLHSGNFPAVYFSLSAASCFFKKDSWPPLSTTVISLSVRSRCARNVKSFVLSLMRMDLVGI